MLIFAVTGMGGIGKTALAVEAAHRACTRGWFPGGTLFVDLRGYDDNPVTADQAVLALLDALGVQGPDLPSTTAQQYDAYRAVLAERRDRMLLILDNASDSSQFLDLLPGTDHHRVLITSRDRPDALPVRLVDLETLAPDESVALIARALHDTDERDDRAEREPDALSELAALCGHLPLALQIAAAMLRRRRSRDIASLVTEIQGAQDPTTVLGHGSDGTDLYGRSLALRPVLETSYRRLPPDQAGLLRLLALAPGTETGTEAVAVLADVDTNAALSLLEDLAARHLVTPIRNVTAPASGLRWRVHDLVRAFCAGTVARDAILREEGEAARERVLAYYCRWAEEADQRLRFVGEEPEPEGFADRGRALAWLDGERAGLVAATQWAREERFASAAVWLALDLVVYLDWRRYFDDLITVMSTAQEVAHRIGDSLAEAVAWNGLGSALQETGQAEAAIGAHTRARELYRVREDRHREAISWNLLGIALAEAGRVSEAVEAHIRARDLFMVVGDRGRSATAWSYLGSALQRAGRLEDALEACTRALGLVRSSRESGLASNSLGTALWKVGRAADAVAAYREALEIYRDFEDWYGVGQALVNLALVQKATGEHAEAHTLYLKAAEAFTRANAPTEAANAQSSADALT